MSRKPKKILIIIPIVILIIAIVVVAVLYIKTDFLKSNEVLFYKYAMQNVDAVVNMVDINGQKEYSEYLKQNAYESNAEVTAEYVKNVDTSAEDKSNEINNMKLTVDGQSDYKNNYKYNDVKLLYNDESLFEAELIKENDTYGIRFTDIIKQFLSVENHDLKALAESAGLTEDQIKNVPDTIDEIDWYSVLGFTDDEISSLKDTYGSIITNSISSDAYTKQSNAMITTNGKTITTTAYAVTLTEEQANNVIVNLLEKMKEDEIVLNKVSKLGEIFESENVNESFIEAIDNKIKEIKDNNIGTNQIKYTVYQAQGKTVRTVVEKDVEKTVIDLAESGSTSSIKIEQTIANTEKENVTTIKIDKSVENSKDLTTLSIEEKIGDDIDTVDATFERTVNGTEIETKLTAEKLTSTLEKQGFSYSRKINITSNMQKTLELDTTNNVVLNNYTPEKLKSIVNIVTEQLSKRLEENTELLNNISNGRFSGTDNGVIIEETGQLSELEVNRFNAKFEFYTGEEISSTQISDLLDVVKNNLKTAQVSYSEDETSKNTETKKKLESIRLTLESGTENASLAESVFDLIETNKKYTVGIQYNETTGMAEYITIIPNSK